MADVNAPSDQTLTMAPPVPPYYQEYQENVAKHRGFLAGETRSTQDLPAPRPAKPARKPQSTSILSSVTSTQPAPTSVLAKTQENKHKQATGTTDKPAKAKRIKRSVADEDADSQKAVEESMKDAYALPKGPLPPVVIREPESGKYQPLPEVPGKGKAKVSEEKVAHDLLSLQKHKKTSLADQYIFQRRVSEPTASSFHDVSLYEVLGQSDSEEEPEKVVLGVKKGSQDEGQAGPDPNAQAEGQTGSDTGAQAEGQAGSNPDETSEGQAGSNPDETSEGQAGPNPGNAEARVQSTSSPVVYAGSDREHMDIDDANVSLQPSTEQLYKGFTATIYPNIQENLKLAVEEPVLLEEPASSSGTLSSLQHLSRDFTFGDQFLSPQQSTTEAMMVKHIGELEHTLADLIQVNKTMEERLDKHGARLYTLEQLDILQQVSIAVSKAVTDAVDWAMQAPLRNRFRDLPEADMKEILHQRMWEIDSYKSHEDHMHLFEALEKSINRDQSEELAHDLAEARKKRKKGRESPKTPPKSPSHQPHPPPPPAGPSGTSRAPRAFGSQVTPPPPPPTSTNQDSPSTGSAAPSPAKTATTTKHQAWSTPDITLKPLVSLTPEDLDMDEAMGPDKQAQLSDEEYIGSAYILTVNLRQGWWKPFEEKRPTTPEPAWSIRSSDVPVPPNNWASTLASNYSPPPEDSLLAQTDVIHLQYQMEECHKLLADSVDDPILRHNVSKPLPLKGPPGQVTIQSDFFFNKDLEYLRYSSKGRRPALSISKMKATYYPDAGLEQMVPDQFWIEEECKYDIAAMYGHLNHLPPKDKKILTKAVNQWTRQLVIRQRVEDFQLRIESYQTQMMMRFNEIHKFNDETLQQIVEALDYRVKEFRINRMNPEAFEDMENLPQPVELCWRTRKRGRLQIVEAYRLIKLLQHYRPLSDDL
nr:hypothetical protein [Tanacetum cinerariifolium]